MVESSHEWVKASNVVKFEDQITQNPRHQEPLLSTVETGVISHYVQTKLADMFSYDIYVIYYKNGQP